MMRVGLTGGIGSGKSVVARILRVLEVPVFDADIEGKRLLSEDRTVMDPVVARFGPSIYPDGILDRKALAALVFHDPAALKDLNSIVHPAVRRSFRYWTSAQRFAYVVMESAILVGSGGHKSFDRLVVVTAPEKLRIGRVMQRDAATEANVRARMKNQATDHELLALADHHLVNDERRLLIPQVLTLHEELIRASIR